MLIKTRSGAEHDLTVGERVGAPINNLRNSGFNNSRFGNVIAVHSDQEIVEVLWDAQVNGPDSSVGFHRLDEIWACGSPVVPQTTSDKLITAGGVIICVPIALGFVIGLFWNFILPIAGLTFLLSIVLAVHFGPALLVLWLSKNS